MKLLDRVVNFVDGVTKAPGWISDQADALNDRFIRIANDLKAATNMAADTAEENIVNTKVREFGGNVFSAVQTNATFIVIGAAVLIGFLIWWRK